MGQSDTKESAILAQISSLEEDASNWKGIISEFLEIPISDAYVKSMKILVQHGKLITHNYSEYGYAGVKFVV